MEPGDITKLRTDVESLFFMTANRVISEAECHELLNSEIRGKIGLSEMSLKDFKFNFTAKNRGPQPGQPVPQGTIKKGPEPEKKDEPAPKMPEVPK